VKMLKKKIVGILLTGISATLIVVMALWLGIPVENYNRLQTIVISYIIGFAMGITGTIILFRGGIANEKVKGMFN
jgi:uncharacterized protein YebE (UPF0316 family)